MQALEPLYTEGEAIAPYEWAGAHAAAYDPEAQNAWGDLPMFVSGLPYFPQLLSGSRAAIETVLQASSRMT